MLITENVLRKIIAEEFKKLQKEAYRGKKSSYNDDSLFYQLVDDLEDQGLHKFVQELNSLSGQARGTGGAEKGINRNPSHGRISREFQSWLVKNGHDTIFLPSGETFSALNGTFERY